MKHLGNTFSPTMLGKGMVGEVREVSLEEIKAVLPELKSVISHEVTAKILSALLEADIVFNRENISLKQGDELFCIIPNFRANEAREFTKEEVEASGFRCFHIEV